MSILIGTKVVNMSLSKHISFVAPVSTNHFLRFTSIMFTFEITIYMLRLFIPCVMSFANLGYVNFFFFGNLQFAD